MESTSNSEYILQFTPAELHLFQEAVLLVHPALEPTVLYDARQWNLLCSTAVVFANAFQEMSDRRKHVSHISSSPSAENNLGGVRSGEGDVEISCQRRLQSWKLYAKPPSISIDRRMLLSSEIGRILENRGLMGFSLLFLVAVNVSLDILAPVSDVGYTSVLLNGDRVFDLRRCSTSILVLHVASRIIFAILLAHRINRQILLTSVFYFETVLSTGALVLAYAVWIANCIFLAQKSYTVQFLVEDCLLLMCSLPIFIFMSASDSLRFGLLPKIISVAVICAQLATTWFRTRCISNDWGDTFYCEPLDNEGVSPREVFLMACTQSLVFIMQCLIKQVSGNEFAVLRPRYCFCGIGSLRKSSCYGLAKIDCCVSAQIIEIETIITRIKCIGSEGFSSHSSDNETIAQSSEMRQVVNQLRPFLVQILNSAWNENIPLDAQFTKTDVSEISSGRSSRKGSCGVSHMKWHLRSDPAKLELSRATLLSSRIGMKLHERHLMAKLAGLLGALSISAVIFDPAKDVVQGGMTYKAWSWYGAVFFSITFCLLMVVLQHNMNRDLFAISFRCFETWVLTIACVVKSVAYIYQISTAFPLDGAFDAIFGYGIITPVFAIHMNSIDCWRFSRGGRISIYFVALVYFLYEYYNARCVQNYWGEPANCSFEWRRIDGFRLREIYLGLLVSCLLFFVKALHRHLTGHVFAIWHPQYCLRIVEVTHGNGIHALDISPSRNIGKQESEDAREEENDYSGSVKPSHDSLSTIIGKQGNKDATVASSECPERIVDAINEEGSACESLMSEQARVVLKKFSL